MTIVSLIAFILILGVLILVHELGHFLSAKKFGIRVEEFGFGFPPRVIGKKVGETIYSINAIPIGGFVKLYGEEYAEISNTDKKKPVDSFVYQHPWKKTVVILGGVFMNLILAIFIYTVLLSTNSFTSDVIPLFTPYSFRFGSQEGRVIAAQTNAGSPAEKAGITSGNIIKRVKTAQSNWSSITSSTALIQTVTNAGNQPLSIEVEDIQNGVKKTVDVTPIFNKDLKRSVIGITLVDGVVLTYQTIPEKIMSGFLHSYNIFSYNIFVMKYLFSTAIVHHDVQPVAQSVSGPIGIFSLVQEMVRSSGNKFIFHLANLIALLSLSLAFVNVLPFPALDGGRLVFIFYEWITGKQPHKRFEQVVNYAGFITLILLAILISYNDILRLIR